MAQRKFLRQLAKYSESLDAIYPRLVVVDFLQIMANENPDNKSGESNVNNDSAQSATPRPRSLKRRNTSKQHQHLTVDLHQHSLAFKILCEHEAGWHSYSDPISAPAQFDESDIARFSPYLARIVALLRNSQQLHLNCATGEDGEKFVEWLEQVINVKALYTRLSCSL